MISYGPGGFKNNSSSKQDFVCPIVRDHGGSSVTDWDVRVDRDGSPATWTVQLKSCDYNGDSCYFSQVTIPSSPLSGQITVDGGSVANHTFAGSLFILSEVPAGALIHSYHVDELNGTE
jgi:hypothetical protein